MDHVSCNLALRFSGRWFSGVVVRMLDLRLSVMGLIPAMTLSDYF